MSPGRSIDMSPWISRSSAARLDPLASPPVGFGFPTPFQRERLIGPSDAFPFQLLPFDWIVLPIGASTCSVLPSTSRHFQGETATKWTRRSAKRSAPGDGFRANGCCRMSRTGAADRELRGEPQEREEKERPKACTPRHLCVEGRRRRC